MGTHLVEAGTVLADRYVVEDLVAQDAGSESWRARDKVLARSVVLQLLPSSSPRATSLLTAAKQVSRITDTRVLQVLDAVDDGQLSYVVREWASGQSLDVLLTEGPLPARRAAWLLREVAAAMANAHRIGIPHGRLTPESVVVTKASGVKLIGVGTAAALKPESIDAPADAELADTVDLGRLLYACLTARWPGEGRPGEQRPSLPPAPREHGRLLRPRQVRAGVPRSLDAICDRILTPNSRYGPAITNVAEVKEILTRVLADAGFGSAAGANQPIEMPLVTAGEDLPPGVLRRDDEAAPPGEQPSHTEPMSSEGSPIGRTLVWTVVIALVLGAVLLAYLIGQHGAQEPAGAITGSTGITGSSGLSGGTSSAPTQPITSPLDVASAISFDPSADGGSGDEHTDEAALAVDGDDATGWQTVTYFNNPRLGGQKPGVGILLDLGSPQDISAVQVTVAGGPTDVEVRTPSTDATADPPIRSVQQYTLDASKDGVDGTSNLIFDKTVQTRYVLVYLTKLPEISSGEYRGTIDEVQVLG